MNDDRLRRLLSDAVSDIEPEDRIEELRATVRPRPKVVPMSRSRSWYAGAGIVATAAVIGVIAYLTSVVGNKSTDLGPATDPGTALPTVTATDTAAPRPSADAGRRSVILPVFYLGHSPRGAVLFRQGTPIPAGSEPLAVAVSRLMAEPYDADYRLGWSPGWLVSAQLVDGVIEVDVGSVPATRPATMSARTAYEIVQSAVYTFRAATHSNATVLFQRSGQAVPTVLGVPTGQPLGPGRAADVLSRVDITRPPLDGRRSGDGRLVVTGTTDRSLGTVVVRLVRERATGGTTVRTGTDLSTGAAGSDGRYRWRVVLDTSALQPGRYTVIARNGRHADADTDTRVVLLR